MIYSQAMRLLSNSDDAENALQLTFIKACDKFDTFDGRSALGTWLYRIATNEALMMLRRQKVVITSLDDVGESQRMDEIVQNRNAWNRDPGQVMLDNELRVQLETALMRIPESLRVVFVLREMHGLSTLETAEALELNENAVKVRLHRARLKLRELLAAYMIRHDDE